MFLSVLALVVSAASMAFTIGVLYAKRQMEDFNEDRWDVYSDWEAEGMFTYAGSNESAGQALMCCSDMTQKFNEIKPRLGNIHCHMYHVKRRFYEVI